MLRDKISIIVPVYNSSNSLINCVESLMGQTYNNIEIILVNDGSQDRSQEICENLQSKDSRIKVIHKKNGGVSSARNAGLRVATGKMIMFCDSDDWVEPTWCETLINHFEPDDIIMCSFIKEYENKFVEADTRRKTIEISRKDFIKLRDYGFYVLWNKIFSKDIIDYNNLMFDERYSNGEDILFILNYIKCINGVIRYVPSIQYHYKCSTEGSLSTSADINYGEKALSMYSIMKKIMKDIGVKDFNDWKLWNETQYNEFSRGISAITSSDLIGFWEKVVRTNRIIKSYEFNSVYKALVNKSYYDRLCGSSHGTLVILWSYLKKLARRQ